MRIMVSLTVAESKRLIAKGVAATAFVRRAMDKGCLAVPAGTTNGYIIEELTGEKIDKRQFVAGRTLPGQYDGPELANTYGDLVIRKGERLAIKAVDAVLDMAPGDVFIKGANAVNHNLGQVAALIGHPSGGTLGAVIGRIVSQRLCLFCPVGLEKSVSGDLHELAEMTNNQLEAKGPSLWVMPGRAFTEIEALETLAGVGAVHVASGGVGGAEGAVWLALFGEAKQIDKAMEILRSTQGEKPFAS